MDEDENNSEDEIVDAVIVDDGQNGGGPGKLGPLVPTDTILTPCHHGCTCGLHQQVLYGERVPEHPAADLDHGEMGLLVAAVGDASRLLHGFHDHFRKLRAAATRTYGRARSALQELALTLDGEALRRARAERDRVEEAYADLTPAERQPAPRWLKVTFVVAAGCMVVFDAYFFQQIFLNILQVTRSDAWWKQDIGLVAALVMAIGVIAAGWVLAGPLWRLRRRWRRQASPDEPPTRRAIRVARAVAACTAPALTFFVLGWWAAFRGQIAVVAQENTINNSNNIVIPSAFAVMLLLLSLAITVIVLEMLVYNPYQADRRRAEQALDELRSQVTACSEKAARAVDAHEIAWRDLRSARDEVISFVHAELARPWETVILPARLRHGRAGGRSIEAEHGVSIRLAPYGNGTAAPGTEQVQITYQIFEGMTQPQPGPGPLAEVVRAVIDLDYESLRQEQHRLEQVLREQFGGPGPSAEPESASARAGGQPDEEEK